MGEEHRASSGSGTAMIVIAILGGLLLVGCCGGAVVIGGVFMFATVAKDAQMEAVKAQDVARDAQMEVLKAQDQAEKEFEAAKQEMEKSEMEGIKVPNDIRTDSAATPAPAFPDEAEKK